MVTGLPFEIMPRVLQRGNGRRQIFFFDEDIVRIERGDSKNTDVLIGKHRGNRRQDPGQGKRKLARDPKSPPSPFFAKKRRFFIFRADERKPSSVLEKKIKGD
jgi:hypothetical protein